MPPGLGPQTRRLIDRAAAAAAAIQMPEHQRGARTFPLLEPAAASINAFKAFETLASRSWAQLASTARLMSGPPSRAEQFAREASGLYIGAIFDAHQKLASVGRKIESAYHELGGPGEFSGPLTQPEVEDLASAYSESSVRLYPDVTPQLGG